MPLMLRSSRRQAGPDANRLPDRSSWLNFARQVNEGQRGAPHRQTDRDGDASEDRPYLNNCAIVGQATNPVLCACKKRNKY